MEKLVRRFSAIGAEFDLCITIDAVRRVRGITGLELTDLQGGQPPLVLRLQDEMTTFLDVAWALVEKQAQEKKVSRLMFEAGITTEHGAMEALEKAFWEEYADFFRPCRPSAARIIENLRPIQPPPAGTSSPADSQGQPA